jgi:hypothetical protein
MEKVLVREHNYIAVCAPKLSGCSHTALLHSEDSAFLLHEQFSAEHSWFEPV